MAFFPECRAFASGAVTRPLIELESSKLKQWIALQFLYKMVKKLPVVRYATRFYVRV